MVASAALAVAAAPWALNQPVLAWIFKPLATLLVIAYAWPRGSDQPAARRWVRLGLIASLAGDVALLWPERGFLPGLVSFLLAHLAYLMAFTRDTRLAARWPPFALYAVIAAVVLTLLWPGVPAALRGPVQRLCGVPGQHGRAGRGGVAQRPPARRRAGGRRRVIHAVGRPAGHQQVCRPAAAGQPVGAVQLLGGAVVHCLVAAAARAYRAFVASTRSCVKT